MALSSQDPLERELGTHASELPGAAAPFLNQPFTEYGMGLAGVFGSIGCVLFYARAHTLEGHDSSSVKGQLQSKHVFCLNQRTSNDKCVNQNLKVLSPDSPAGL